MVIFILNISNPWSDRFKNIVRWSGKTPIKNKFWELEILKDACILTAEIHFNERRDHAGFKFELGLFGYAMLFQIYDNRHWDYTNDCWEK
jgi:hypothetical protein